ncbi:HlyD family secretion protein [Sphingomonas sp.]|uniref:HlyD family secretion protein n=1 Tax=Sphingomonas sp. TaxID=28214 RepID=UPI000DB197C0|nr:HlyD family secretion protein [Sphingomonas sp.]PZU07764.1 MAG: secretion protein HlyD [Sphingomonas sp.]
MTAANQDLQQSETATDQPGGQWRPARRRPLLVAVTIVLTFGALLVILAAWNLPPFSGGREGTDNAYVRGRTTVIAPQVSGYVMRVLVRDYETVKAGQVLVTIDDRVYRARVEQARANLAAAQAALDNSTQARASRAAGLQGQVAGVASAEAQLQRARADMTRADDLARDGSISVRERDQTLAALALAQAQLRQAHAASEIGRQDIRTVDVGRGGLEAQVEAARAQLHAAEIDLEHTVIRAPEGGTLGEVGIRVGAYVSNGTQLLSIVPPDRWIIANFKEAQTARIRAGQKVSFTVDALGNIRLSGRVERLAPAAGSEFAVLKPDNATGNFVKIPQRIGVRIAVDPHDPDARRLRPGMSVEVHIDTSDAS